MLRKLLKHELCATARVMLPVMGALLALAVLANLSLIALTGGLEEIAVLRIILVVIVMFFGSGIVATGVMAIVIMANRFYRNLLKDEGYLMFTLPVSVHELVWSKLLVSLLWFLATALLIFLVLSITMLNVSNTSLSMVLENLPSWAELRRSLAEHGILGQVNLLAFQMALAAVLATLAACLHFYSSMALGHMFSKNKILLSVVFYVGISFVFKLAEMGCGIFGYGVFDSEFMYAPTESEGLRFFSGVLWHAIVLGAVQSAVLYVATVLGLKRGLNLE